MLHGAGTLARRDERVFLRVCLIKAYSAAASGLIGCLLDCVLHVPLGPTHLLLIVVDRPTPLEGKRHWVQSLDGSSESPSYCCLANVRIPQVNRLFRFWRYDRTPQDPVLEHCRLVDTTLSSTRVARSTYQVILRDISICWPSLIPGKHGLIL
jgi:hypothetical protein